MVNVITADAIHIRGEVSVYQEDAAANREYLIQNVPNHFVDALLKGFSSFMCGDYINSSACWANGFTITLGTDTTTETTHNMTGLVAPIGTAPGTPPNVTSGGDVMTDGNGKYWFDYIAVWNPGTVEGTVGELALNLKPFTNISYNYNETSTKSLAMCSRLAVADNSLEPFTIDPNRSLTITWGVSITYE